MADLEFLVEYGSILKADKAAQDLEKSFKEIVQASERGAASQEKLVKMWGNLSQYGLKLSDVYRSMNKDMKSNQDTSARLEKEYRDLSLSQKSARDSARAMEVEFRKQEKATKELADQERRRVATLEALKLKYNPLYAALKQYDSAQSEILQAERHGILSKEQTKKKLSELTQEYKRFQSGASGWSNQFVSGSDRSGKSANRLGMAVQQTGYQVGDFLVQWQSGANVLVAFGQQATQLVGVLPMLEGSIAMSRSALIGLSTGLGIAIPLITAIGAAFMRTSESSDKAGDSISDLEQDLKSLDETLKDWLRTKKAASLGITAEELIGTEGIDKAIQDVRTVKEEIALLEKQIEATIVAGGMGQALVFRVGMGDQNKDLEESYKKLNEAEVNLWLLREKQFEEASKESEAKKKELEDRKEALSIEEQYNYLLDSRGMFIEAQQRLRNENGEKLLEQARLESEEAEKYAQLLRDQHASEIAIWQAGEEAYTKKLLLQEKVDQVLRNQNVTLQEGLTLLEASVTFGADSLEYLRLQNQQAVDNLRLRLEQQAAADGISESEKEAIDSAVELLKKQNDLKESILAGSKLWGSFSDAVGQVNFSVPIAGADVLVARLSKAYSFLLRMANLFKANKKEGPLGFGKDIDEMDQRAGVWGGLGLIPLSNIPELPEGWMESTAPSKADGSGGGASSAAKELQKDVEDHKKRVEALVESFQTERETLDIWYAEKETLLNDARTKEILGIEGHNNLKEKLEAEHQQRLKNLKLSEMQVTASAVSGVLDGLAGIMNSSNRKQFEAQKKFSVASALVSGGMAAVSAWEKGMLAGGLPTAALWASASALKTATQVQGIQSQSFSGGGSVGGSGSGASITTPTATTQAPQQVIIQGLTAGMRLTPEELQDMFDQIYEENESRGTVFQVAGV